MTQRAVAYIRAHPNQLRELTDAQLAENGFLQSTRAQAWAAVAPRPSRRAWEFRDLAYLGVAAAVIFPMVWIVIVGALATVVGVIREILRQTGVPENLARIVAGLLALAAFGIATVVAYRIARRAYHRLVAADRRQRPTVGR